MAETTWTFEFGPGQGWDYNQEALTYNEDMFDGFNVRYKSIGTETSWSFESK